MIFSQVNNLNKKFFIVIITFFVLFFASCTVYIEKQKLQAEAHRNLGEVYMNEGEYTFALRELLKAEKIYRNDPFLYNDLGLTYMAKGKNDLAIDHFRKAVKIKPDYAPAMNNMGTAYLAKGDWDMAIICFKKVTKDLLYITPHYPLYNIGWAYYNKKEYQLAEQFYLEALKLQPEFIKALLGIGRTYIKQDRFHDAVASLETAVTVYEKAVKKLGKAGKLSPQYAAIYFELARGYQFSHSDTKAVEAYHRISLLFPGSKQAKEAQKKAAEID